jgi:tetratricopeptide (TPR) repeat protein
MILCQLVQLSIQLDSGTQEAHRRWHDAVAFCAANNLANRPHERARLHHLLGEIYYREGKYAEASNEHRHAIMIIGGADDSQAELCCYYDALAKSLKHEGKRLEALDLHDRALKTAKAGLCDTHPDNVKLKMNYGLALIRAGKFPEAWTWLDGALRSMSETRRHASLDAGMILGHLSELSYVNGELEKATKYGQESLEIYQRANAPAHRIAEAHTNLGNAEIKRKNFKGALDCYREALKHRGQLSAGHHQLGVNEGSIAEALVGMRHYDEAMAHIFEAERLLSHSSPHDREAHAWILMVHGEALLGQNRPRKAITLLEQALRLCESDPTDASNKACIKWALARALRRRGSSPKHVRSLAEEARTLFEGRGSHEASRCLAINEFLKLLEDPGGGPSAHGTDANGGVPRF